MTRIIQVTSGVDVEAARRLFSDYAESLEIDLSFQDFARELHTLPGDYVPPLGALLLALGDEGAALGCVALRPWKPPHIAELKRLYVAPAGRGNGLGLELTLAALDMARTAGYQSVRLDTLSSMDRAQRLYERLGFREIEPYRFNPVEGARFMGLELNVRAD